MAHFSITPFNYIALWLININCTHCTHFVETSQKRYIHFVTFCVVFCCQFFPFYFCNVLHFTCVYLWLVSFFFFFVHIICFFFRRRWHRNQNFDSHRHTYNCVWECLNDNFATLFVFSPFFYYYFNFSRFFAPFSLFLCSFFSPNQFSVRINLTFFWFFSNR